jgi:hypothetical protein
MSDAIFPSLPGLKWGTVKKPIWSTKIQKSASGREARASFYSYPIYQFTLSYEVLRGQSGMPELQTLLGFFNARQGSFDSFLYEDIDDNTATDQQFGTGNGSTTVFQLIRSLGGNVEPVFALKGSPLIYSNIGDWRGAVRLSTSARTNILLQSNTAASATWTNTGLSSVATGLSSPDGGTNACKLIENTSSSLHMQHQVHNPIAGNTYCLSRFFKADGRSKVRLLMGYTGGGSADFDLAAGTVIAVGGSGHSAGIKAYAGGWYRCWVCSTPTATTAGQLQSLMLTTASTYTGDGASGVQVFGAQHEVIASGAPNEPTNPIVTTTAAVTAPADYSVGSTAAITFATAPTSPAVLTWSGQFYYRCRFLQDSTEFEQFLKQLWSNKKVEFVTVKR